MATEETPAMRSMLDQAAEPPPALTARAAADLTVAASTFLVALRTDPEWEVVRRTLEQLARDNSIDGILRRQEAAMREITGREKSAHPYVVHGGKDYSVVSEGTARVVSPEARAELVAELQAAAADFHARALPEAAMAVQNIPSDVRVAADRIARAARSTLSHLPPYWLVAILWWLIVFGSSKEIEALALMYMVLNDTVKKKG